jgi:hypothetical protein
MIFDARLDRIGAELREEGAAPRCGCESSSLMIPITHTYTHTHTHTQTKKENKEACLVLFSVDGDFIFFPFSEKVMERTMT